MPSPPLSRLVGLETEYAIRVGTRHVHPGNDIVFQALKESISDLVATRPGSSAAGRDQIFTENGGAFYYEFLPHCMHGGLIEGATPECRGPTQTVLYQRAQEALLVRSLPAARFELQRWGHDVELGLLKNCRDAEDHIYGSQENYEVDLARGWRLGLLRLVWVLLLPVLLVQLVLVFGLLLALLLVSIPLILAISLVPSWSRRMAGWISSDSRRFEAALGRFVLYLSLGAMWPLARPICLALRLLAFRPLRHHLLPFLVSRTVITGAGSVAADRTFQLGEKATAIVGLMRSNARPVDRTIFDVGHLLKAYCAPFNLQLRPLLGIFRRRQRLQLGHGDSNRCQVAEFLKVGTTTLVLDMIEDGFLDPPPRLRRPVDALHTVARDVNLEASLETHQGSITALQLQRFYLDQAKAYLQQQSTVSLEARQVVRLWEEVLDHLERKDFGALVGQLDWVTKRYLLEECGADDDTSVLKTLDLRYHELDDGYFETLKEALERGDLVEPGAIEDAILTPPEDTPAHFRGRLIRQEVDPHVPISVSWESARIGGPFRAKVVPFRRPDPG